MEENNSVAVAFVSAILLLGIYAGEAWAVGHVFPGLFNFFQWFVIMIGFNTLAPNRR